MHLEEVPQDKKKFKDGENAPKKVLYVTHADGSYVQTNSAGWEAENVALEQAWEEIDHQLAQEKLNFEKGVSSPIAYYMTKNRMDIGILAAYVNKWQWQVKRHIKPSVFTNLSEKMLQKYAEVFNISIEQLKKPE
ncbi:MAG: hypothetical protein IPI46_07565 [Bacteroidetes bacterium]|nr:hypothetical protein [Bacteroidota bacterium]